MESATLIWRKPY